MNKVNIFSCPFKTYSLIFLSSLTIANEVALVANLGKAPLVKETASLILLFCLD